MFLADVAGVESALITSGPLAAVLGLAVGVLWRALVVERKERAADSASYAAMLAGLAKDHTTKLEAAQSRHDAASQAAHAKLEALARENQDFLRKLLLESEPKN